MRWTDLCARERTCMDVTLPTSHVSRGWLNNRHCLNVPCADVKLLVSQSPMPFNSSLTVPQPLNSSSKFVIFFVFHVATGPYSSMAFGRLAHPSPMASLSVVPPPLSSNSTGGAFGGRDGGDDGGPQLYSVHVPCPSVENS